jgi:hypothetical protein
MAFDPSSLLDFSHLAVFLGGTAVGAAGTYMADRFTDQRRKREVESEGHDRFVNLESQMSAFFAELRADLAAHPDLGIREFVLLPNERVMFNHDRQRFEYYESKYPGVQNWTALLVEAGFVEVIRETGTPIFRLREQFVARLQRNA